MNKVAVIDYGMGNLRSVCKAITHVAPQAAVSLTADPDAIRGADRVVFPGQGAIGGCVAALVAAGLDEALREAVREKPFLGICLGLQALYEFCEEGGGTKGLGILPGRVRRFSRETMIDPESGDALKVPHMGWNRVQQVSDHPLWRGIAPDERFYFVHSYYAESGDPKSVMGTTDYGVRFTSAASHENIFATQFHPEKSQRAGLRLLENFVSWEGQS
jgi:imidazole glycerol-phosphate synthase subunit HisH